jgi:hypothetical protein
MIAIAPIDIGQDTGKIDAILIAPFDAGQKDTNNPHPVLRKTHGAARIFTARLRQSALLRPTAAEDANVCL